jgi:uncharacterized protein YeeX (DUF496 family)
MFESIEKIIQKLESNSEKLEQVKSSMLFDLKNFVANYFIHIDKLHMDCQHEFFSSGNNIISQEVVLHGFKEGQKIISITFNIGNDEKNQPSIIDREFKILFYGEKDIEILYMIGDIARKIEESRKNEEFKGDIEDLALNMFMVEDISGIIKECRGDIEDFMLNILREHNPTLAELSHEKVEMVFYAKSLIKNVIGELSKSIVAGMNDFDVQAFIKSVPRKECDPNGKDNAFNIKSSSYGDYSLLLSKDKKSYQLGPDLRDISHIKVLSNENAFYVVDISRVDEPHTSGMDSMKPTCYLNKGKFEQLLESFMIDSINTRINPFIYS